MFFAKPSELRALGVLGMNKRNGDCIAAYNRRRYYPRVDNKLETKRLAQEAGVAVPELYAVIESNHQSRRMAEILGERSTFVIKPAHGSGGDGIIVIDGRAGSTYRKVNGMPIDLDGLRHHVSNIISGMYSLGGQPDIAMIEYRVDFDPFFAPVTFQGVPDIRTIVYRGYPVMAMVRLPTRFSGGKANLHQGAVGAGIEIVTGTTLSGVWHNQLIETHPDTGAPVRGLTIPGWDKLLRLATGCYELSQLGYLGVDVVLDAHFGPLILELNARPGLNIQLANRVGLGHRLKAIDAVYRADDDVEARVQRACSLFADLPKAAA